jgi:ketosteroid isomerase-like protein
MNTRMMAALLALATAATGPAAAAPRNRLAALEAEVSDLKAKDEIREMFNLYGFTADTGDARGWSEVWAPDAVYDGVGGKMAGREQFKASIDDPNGVHKQQIEGKGSLHTTGPLTIRVKGDTAWAEGHTLVWVREGTNWRPFTLSYNHWDLKRIDGRWRIARRFSRPVSPGAAGQVFTGWKSAY